MTELWFYHLQHQPLEAVLPNLLARSLDRGWRVVVEARSRERVAALDEHLWTFSDDSFLPHARGDEPDLAEEPIVLLDGPGNPNNAQARFLIDGAAIPEDIAAYDRVFLLFDGNDAEAVAFARGEWRRARTLPCAPTYWQQDADGRWGRKA